jgi:PAS domain S-box-containing protein
MATDHNELEMFRSIAGRMNGFLYRCKADEAFTMLYMTASVSNLLGYPAHEFIDNRVRTLPSIVYPEDEAAVGKVFEQCSAQKTPWDVEYRVMHRDGYLVWVTEQGAGVYGSDGELEFLEGFVFSSEGRRAAEVKNQQRLKQLTDVSNRILTDTDEILRSLRTLTILAFNAKVEAARSGDAGRGFAVIAEQVGALANDTSLQARKIDGHLSTVRAMLST